MAESGRRRPVLWLADTPALWPSPEYDRQITRLREAVGKHIYLVEARFDDLHLSAQYSGTAHELLEVLDFPRPDPTRRLYPHLLLLDDGRGINLGRILRVSLEEPYAPLPVQRLFEDRALGEALLEGERRLSRERIRLTARRQLGDIVRDSRRAQPRLQNPLTNQEE